GGTIAAAADGGRFVWAPGDTGQPVVHSLGFGTTWTASTGVPANAIVASDRVNAKRFYAFSNGTFYTSTDGGSSFTATAATGLPASNWNVTVKALPGGEGEIWVSGGATWTNYGLWRSTNGGATFTRVSTVEQADNIGFGKAAPGRTSPALFTCARISGRRGVFRSDDTGRTWVRVNDDTHQWGAASAAITGDPAIYGRVYLAGYGRGTLYGDRIPAP
ncbi:MAG: sialidase family protein, partial [Umezawaea sp.]